MLAHNVYFTLKDRSEASVENLVAQDYPCAAEIAVRLLHGGLLQYKTGAAQP